MQASQRGAAGRQFLAVGSQETHAERAQQAGAGIVGSAAAEAEDNLPRPASSAARISSPVPRLLLRVASRRSRGTRCKPLAEAISITAVASSSQPQCARVGSPSGPSTRHSRRSPAVAASTASTVPSPPSASGRSNTSACGKTRRQPRAIASATSGADRLSLNESGAITIFISHLAGPGVPGPASIRAAQG